MDKKDELTPEQLKQVTGGTGRLPHDAKYFPLTPVEPIPGGLPGASAGSAGAGGCIHDLIVMDGSVCRNCVHCGEDGRCAVGVSGHIDNI